MKKIKYLIIVVVLIFAVILLKKYVLVKNNINIASINKTEDVIEPEIIIDKEKVIIVKGDEFIPNIKATDNLDGDITDKIITEGEVNSNIIGNYKVKYTVSDSSNNKVEKTQEIEVRNPLQRGLPVLMYHFFYSKDDPNYAGKTPNNNLITVEKYAEQMDYLIEEDFYFPTWKEVEDYIDGKINLPEKSVVITDDDGNFTFFVLAVPVTEDRKIPVTSFVITSLYEDRLDEKHEFVNYQSHSDDMHKSGSSGKGVMVNWNYDDIVKDLKKSKEKIESHTGNECTIYCYPFGHYNDTAIKALSDCGYNLAFTVEGGRVKPNANKLKLPRVRINGDTTMEEFKESVK